MNDLTPGIGHNQPPADPFDETALKERLASDYREVVERFIELRQGAERLVEHEVRTDEQAQRLVDFVAHQCTPALAKAESARKTEKAPYLAGGRIVDGFFSGRISDFEEKVVKPIKAIGAKYQQKKRQEQLRREEEDRRRAAEEQRRAEAEAARLAAEAAAETNRKRAAELGRMAEEEADRATQAAQIVEAPSAPTRIHGDYGATAFTKERFRWDVTDPTAIPLEYLRTNDEAIAAAVKRGVREIPGLRIYREEQFIIRKC